MKKTLFPIAVFLLAALQPRAQFLDSIHASLDRKGSFIFDFNSRNSFITSYGANIWGFMAGVCFDRKIAIGGGLNILNTPITKNEPVNGQSVTESLNFGYISYFVEYIFRVQKHWEIDVPVSIGYGNSNYSYFVEGVQKTQDQKPIIPLEPQVEVDYDFWKNKFGNYIFGVYVQLGYRLMLVNNNLINENFNSTTYSYGILIFPGELYSAIFPRTGLAKTIEAP